MPNIVTQTRPENIDEIVGLEQVKRNIRYHVRGAQKLDQPLPSWLVVGPAGVGKSTVAECISITSKRRNGDPGEVTKVLASDIRDPEDLIDMASQVEDGDVIYLEEAHTLGGTGKKAGIVQATLLEWIENFKLLNAGASNILEAPRVSFVFPTTNPGRLSSALRSRCQILHLSYYDIEDIMEILYRAGLKCGLDLSQNTQALRLLAQSSRGTPRTAIMHRLDMLRKVMAVDEKPYSMETVHDMLEINHINEWGLESNDILYCEKLYSLMCSNGYKAVGKKTMQQVTGFSDDMIDNMIEAYLIQIGVISIQHRGRVLTKFGCDILGYKAVEINSLETIKSKNIDLDKLKEIMQDDHKRKSGMKGIAKEFGLTYGPDNKILKEALNSIGYTVKQRAGIIPCQD